MSLGEIRKTRYTQLEIAELLNVNIKTINFIESKKGCSLELALRYSALIGYQIDPTHRVAKAFSKLNHVSVTSVIQACREFQIEFDPSKLFEV
jgi:DNA-binding XRE family transcriptional regulator